MYLVETKLTETKSIFFALKSVYGLGKSQSFLICGLMGCSPNLKIKNLSEDQILKLLKLIEASNLVITSELKKSRLLIFKKLASIKSYRGLRRINGLPVRGQRTHTNAKSAKLLNFKMSSTVK